jgi:hypothetical protein
MQNKHYFRELLAFKHNNLNVMVIVTYLGLGLAHIHDWKKEGKLRVTAQIYN